jgi:hypothetical protein
VTAQTRIVSIAYVIVAALSWVLTDLRLVLVPTAAACLVLFLGGFAAYQPLRGALSLPWPSIKATDEPLGTIVIDGRECPFLGYDQELLAVIRLRHLPELIASVLLPAAVLYAVFFLTISWQGFGPTTYFYGAEFACIGGWIVLAACLCWFEERRLIGKSHYTIGTIVGMDPGFLRRGVTYQFFVPPAERHGGHGPVWGKGAYNAVLVLYDPRDPDRNAPHGGFFFHDFTVGLAPGRRRLRTTSPDPAD